MGSFRHLGLTGTEEGLEEMLKLSDKWFDYLDDQINLGKKKAIELELRMFEIKYDTRFHPNFGDLWTDFLQKEGYDSIIAQNVPLPQSNILDDYFIALKENTVTTIVNP